jgi:hypothetical protein
MANTAVHGVAVASRSEGKAGNSRDLATHCPGFRFRGPWPAASLGTMGPWAVLSAVAEPTQSINGLFAAALPSALAAGLFAIGALLVNIQIQQTATATGVQQLVKSVEELKTDSKQRLDDLERRVRSLEIQK